MPGTKTRMLSTPKAGLASAGSNGHIAPGAALEKLASVDAAKRLKSGSVEVHLQAAAGDNVTQDAVHTPSGQTTPAPVTNGTGPSPQPSSSAPATAGPAAEGVAAPAGGPAATAEADEAPKQSAARTLAEEDALLARAHAISALQAQLALGASAPPPEQPRPACHHAYLLREMRWLANDFGQERLWRMTAARTFAREAAAARLAQGKRPQVTVEVKCGDPLGKAVDSQTLDRVESGRSASTSKAASKRSADRRKEAAGDGDAVMFADLGADGLAPPTPLAEEQSLLFFHADERVQPALLAHLALDAEKRVIDWKIMRRDFELELQAARDERSDAIERENAERERRAAAAARLLAPVPAPPVYPQPTPAVGYDEEYLDDFGKKPGRRQKKSGRDYLDEEDDLDFKRAANGSIIKRVAPRSSYDRGDQRERDRSRKRGRQMDSDDEEIIPTRSTRRRPAPGSSRRSDPANDSQRGIGRNTRGGLKRDDSGQLVSGPVLWSADEDKLLHAIVHEFGSNWSLVCDVLASSTALQGIARPARQVKERYKEIQTMVEAGTAPPAVVAATQMNKNIARDLLSRSLPVPDEVLRIHVDRLIHVGTLARQKRALEERRAAEARAVRPDAHASHDIVVQRVFSMYNTYLTPVQLTQLTAPQAPAPAQGPPPQPGDAAAHQQQQQQQQQQGQQMQAPALQQQQLPPGSAQLQLQPGQQPPAQAQQMAPPMQPGQQPPPQQPTPPLGAAPPGMQPGMALSPAQAQQPGLAPPMQGGPPGLPSTAGVAAQPGVSGGASAAGQPAAGQPRRQAPSTAVLQTILKQGRMPNGAPLTAEQRANIIAQLKQRHEQRRQQVLHLQHMVANGTPAERMRAQELLTQMQNATALAQQQQQQQQQAQAAAAGTIPRPPSAGAMHGYSQPGLLAPQLPGQPQMAAGGLPGVPGMQQPMSPGSYNSGVMSVGSPVQMARSSSSMQMGGPAGGVALLPGLGGMPGAPGMQPGMPPGMDPAAMQQMAAHQQQVQQQQQMGMAMPPQHHMPHIPGV